MTDDPGSTDSTDQRVSPPRLSRRRVLTAMGAGAVSATGLAGATQSEGGRTLELSVFQTERMATAARVERGDPAHAQMVVKAYAEAYFAQFIEMSTVFDSLDVRVRAPPVSIDTANEYDNPNVPIEVRLLDWNGALHGEYNPSPHGNLLIDVPVGESAIGIAFLDEADSMRGKMTDASVLDWGPLLCELDLGDVVAPEQAIPYIQNDEAVHLPEMVAMAGAHELGHNCKLNHNEGTSRLANDEMAASTVMTGPYLVYYGSMKDSPNVPNANACGEEYHTIDAETTPLGVERIHDDVGFYPTTASDCELRSFENDARDLAREGAAGYSQGALAPSRAQAGDDALDEGVVTTELPDCLHERWLDASGGHGD